MMTKRQLIDEITAINQTAEPSFLAKFDDSDLDDYLRHLNAARLPRLSGDPRRFDKYFQGVPRIDSAAAARAVEQAEREALIGVGPAKGEEEEATSIQTLDDGLSQCDTLCGDEQPQPDLHAASDDRIVTNTDDFEMDDTLDSEPILDEQIDALDGDYDDRNDLDFKTDSQAAACSSDRRAETASGASANWKEEQNQQTVKQSKDDSDSWLF